MQASLGRLSFYNSSVTIRILIDGTCTYVYFFALDNICIVQPVKYLFCWKIYNGVNGVWCLPANINAVNSIGINKHHVVILQNCVEWRTCLLPDRFLDTYTYVCTYVCVVDVFVNIYLFTIRFANCFVVRTQILFIFHVCDRHALSWYANYYIYIL